MAKIKLTALLSQLALISFEFSKPQVTKTKDGEVVLVLPLITPIERVTGSQRVAAADGSLHTVFADDVNEVRIHERDFKDNEDFEWDTEMEIGTYKGEKLSWDVAKRSQEAWLVSTSFASMGNEMRNENQRTSYSKYIPAGSGNANPPAKNAAGGAPKIVAEPAGAKKGG